MFRSNAGLFTVLSVLILFLIAISCKRGPETQDPFSLEVRSDVVEEFEDIRWAEHDVVAREVISGNKYVYVRVEEGPESYWIATGKGKVEAGKRYVFNEAVVKYDFRSESLQRKFDSIYLVTHFLPEARRSELKRLRFNPHSKKPEEGTGEPGDQGADTPQVQQVTAKELLDDPKRFQDQRIELSGVCTKVNAGIMDRNWIHLKESPDAATGIVATSDALPQVGETITIQAIVRLDKDFGSGYRYPVLLEEAIIIQ